MKLDYLNILQTKGFKMPKNFTNYDYNNMVEIQDTRNINILNIINYALNGLKIIYSDKNIINGLINNKNYFVKISDSSLICMLKAKNNAFIENKEFSLTWNKDGLYTFKRVLISDKGILIIDFIMDKESFLNKVIVKGYDRETLALLSESVLIDNEVLYETIILNFLNENSILPDMHRILTIFSQNNFVDKSIILMEEDTISKNSTKYLIDSIDILRN